MHTHACNRSRHEDRTYCDDVECYARSADAASTEAVNEPSNEGGADDAYDTVRHQAAADLGTTPSECVLQRRNEDSHRVDMAGRDPEADRRDQNDEPSSAPFAER